MASAVINPLPFVEGLIAAGSQNGHLEYVRPKIFNALCFHEGSPMNNQVPSPEIVSEELRLNNTLNMEPMEVVKFSDLITKYGGLVHNFKLPGTREIFNLKGKLIKDLEGWFGYNSRTHPDLNERDEVIRAILTALSGELGPPENRVQDVETAQTDFETPLIQLWARADHGKFVAGVLKKFTENPGFDPDQGWAADIARFQFRPGGFIRRTQRFLGDKYATLCQQFPDEKFDKDLDSYKATTHQEKTL